MGRERTRKLRQWTGSSFFKQTSSQEQVGTGVERIKALGQSCPGHCPPIEPPSSGLEAIITAKIIQLILPPLADEGNCGTDRSHYLLIVSQLGSDSNLGILASGSMPLTITPYHPDSYITKVRKILPCELSVIRCRAIQEFSYVHMGESSRVDLHYNKRTMG